MILRRSRPRVGRGGRFSSWRAVRRRVRVCSCGSGSGALPSGFQETTVFTGLTNPTAVEFASDGRVFVAEKSGVIKVFDNLSDTTPTVFADLRTNVYNFWDRGLLGTGARPGLPGRARTSTSSTRTTRSSAARRRAGARAASTRTRARRRPGATADGCVVSGRLSRLTASGNVDDRARSRSCVEDWCQQYPSHSIGSLAFGADGALYVTRRRRRELQLRRLRPGRRAAEPVRRPARRRRRDTHAANGGGWRAA